MDWYHFAHCRGVSSLRGGRTIVLSALFSLFAHPNALLPCLTPKLSRADSTGGMEQIKQPLSGCVAWNVKREKRKWKGSHSRDASIAITQIRLGDSSSTQQSTCKVGTSSNQ